LQDRAIGDIVRVANKRRSLASLPGNAFNYARVRFSTDPQREDAILTRMPPERSSLRDRE
jgi:hypothetical protein